MSVLFQQCSLPVERDPTGTVFYSILWIFFISLSVYFVSIGLVSIYIPSGFDVLLSENMVKARITLEFWLFSS